jgi:ribosomal protein S4
LQNNSKKTKELYYFLEKARAQLTELKLLTAADVLESRLQMAVERDTTYLSFLVDLFNAELGE